MKKEYGYTGDDMRFKIICYSSTQNTWLEGFIEGNGMAWNHCSLSPIKDLSKVRKEISFYLPLKRYVELYIASQSFFNELGIRNFCERTRKFIGHNYVWVDDTSSTTEWRSNCGW